MIHMLNSLDTIFIAFKNIPENEDTQKFSPHIFQL